MFVLPTVGVQTRGPPGHPGPNFPRSQTRIPMLTQPSEIRKWGVGVRVSGSRDLSGGEGLGGSPQELAVRGCAVFSHLHFSVSGHHPYPPEFRNQEKGWQQEKPSVPLEAEPVLWCPSRCLSSPCTCAGWAWASTVGTKQVAPFQDSCPLRTPVQGTLFLRQNPHTVFQNHVLNE